MPRGDGTGPMGLGPMTGRRAGFCTGATPFGGYGFKRSGYLCGRGYNNPVYIDAADRKDILKRQAEDLQYQLEQVKKDIADLDK